MPYTKIAQENRERMLEQGLVPELVEMYLLQSHPIMIDNFNSIKHMMSLKDQERMEAILLQGTLLLTVVSGAKLG
jgi:hypothetical protein